MITTNNAKQRIQQLLRQDNNSDDKMDRKVRIMLLFIEHHLHQFFARYAQDNQLSMQQASQQVDKWDVRQWQDAVNSYDMSDWSDEAINRVNAYSQSASINKAHMITSITALGIIWLGEQNQRGIAQRVGSDGNDQVKWTARYLDLGSSQQKRAYSIITQPETQQIWSKNLWMDTDSLANDVENLVNQHLRHGVSLNDLNDMLASHANPKQFKPNQSVGDRVQQMQFNTRRIVRTESSRLIHEVNMSTYQQVGITAVRLQNQPGACLKCQDLAAHGVYQIENAPMIPDDTHPNCRCIIAPAGDSHSRYVTSNHLY